MSRLPYLGAVLAGCVLALTAGLLAAQSLEGEPARSGTAVTVQEIGPSGLPLPRFVSLRASEVNLRSGPGIRYPIDWVYTAKGLPLEVIDEFETWRRVRDWQGSSGWVHQSMLSGQRGALVVETERLLRRAPEAGAPGIARVQANVVARLNGCRAGWCEVEIQGVEGWLRRAEIYGAYAHEEIE